MKHSAIPPFWTRLRQISLFPLRGEALLTLVVLSLASVLTDFPILGFFVWLFLLAMAYKYAFSVLRDTAHGHLEAQAGMLDAPDSVLIKFLVLNFTLALAVFGLSQWLGVPGFLLGLLFASLVQPAATMSLAMENSLAAALNPATWIALMQRIGASYFLVCVLLLVFQISVQRAEALLLPLLPWVLAGIVAQAVFLWGLFATFHLMGYLLYQSHEALGFEPNRHEAEAEIPRSPDQRLLAAAGARLQEGDAAGARALIEEVIGERAVGLDVHELYRRLLKAGDAREPLLRHGRQYLHLLIQEKQDRRALGLARECLDADPGFATLDAADGLRLAERAATLGQHKLTLDLLVGVARSHVREAEGVEAALRAAELLRTRHDRPDEAEALLRQVHSDCRSAAGRERIEAALAG